jgi:sensor c-di-GMP phosphodiesterase-like protein
MGLKTALTHTVLPKRRYLLRSLLISLLVFFLFTLTTLFIVHHRNEIQQRNLAEHTVKFALTFMNELTTVMTKANALQPLPCSQAQAALNHHSTFTSGVRTLVLVKNGIAYCSSATGEMSKSVDTLYPGLNLARPIDMILQQGTLMVPDRPAIGVWLSSPGKSDTGVLATLDINLAPYLLFSLQNNNSLGLAIVVGDRAMTTFHFGIISQADLPKRHAQEIPIPGFPLKLLLYSSTLSPENIRFTLLIGLLVALATWALSYYIMLFRHGVDRELLYAMKTRQFHVVYQPVVHSANKKVAGVEALLRWNHPVEGAIPPDVFINYAETQGLIIPLTQHLFALLIEDAGKLASILPAKSKLAVNISPWHMTDPDFKKDVLGLIAELPAHHFNLVFEITERGMVDEEIAQEMFSWLRQQGVEIAVDDFGTGHSALIYLERFTFDYLKIDRGFVMTIGKNTVTTPVLDTILTLTRQLKLNTVAEGVETTQQANYLVDHGVGYLQGYLYSKPLGVTALAQFMLGYPHQ